MLPVIIVLLTNITRDPPYPGFHPSAKPWAPLPRLPILTMTSATMFMRLSYATNDKVFSRTIETGAIRLIWQSTLIRLLYNSLNTLSQWLWLFCHSSDHACLEDAVLNRAVPTFFASSDHSTCLSGTASCPHFKLQKLEASQKPICTTAFPSAEPS